MSSELGASESSGHPHTDGMIRQAKTGLCDMVVPNSFRLTYYNEAIPYLVRLTGTPNCSFGSEPHARTYTHILPDETRSSAQFKKEAAKLPCRNLGSGFLTSHDFPALCSTWLFASLRLLDGLAYSLGRASSNRIAVANLLFSRCMLSLGHVVSMR